ncbi:MAG: HD domain-containing protein [Candidatus Helarchaeota archaeon]
MKRFRNYLKEKSMDYYEKFLHIEQIAKTNLEKIKYCFPEYTDHGIYHSNQLEKFLDYSIPNKIKRNMDFLEIFMLLSSIFLHDIGMVCEDVEENDQEKLEEIRKNHHIRSRKFVVQKYRELLIDEYEAQYIGTICEAHRSNKTKNIFSIDESIQLRVGHNIRLRFLCSCLRIADECHITYDRVKDLIDSFKTLSTQSKQHFIKHYRLIGIATSPIGEIIQISGKINSDQEKLMFERLRRKIQTELDEVRPILRSEGIVWNILFLKLEPTYALNLRNQSITFKVLQELLTKKEYDFNELKTKLSINGIDIQIIIKDLIQDELISESNGKFKIKSDLAVLGKILNEFVIKEKRYKLFFSNYFNDFIDNNLLEITKKRFKTYFNEKDLKIILELTKFSPSALEYVLFADMTFYENTHQDIEKIKNKMKDQEIKEFEGINNQFFANEIINRFNYDFYIMKEPLHQQGIISWVSSKFWLEIFYKNGSSREYYSESVVEFLKPVLGIDIEPGQLLFPADVDAEIKIGISFIEQKLYGRALSWFSRMIAERKKLKEVWNNLGLAYILKENFKKAISCFDNALAIDEELKESWSNRGLAAQKLGFFEESIKNFDKALKIDEKLPKTLYYKGLSLFNMEKFEDAIKSWNESILHGNNDPQIWYQLSRAFLRINDLSNALNHNEKAISLNDKNLAYKIHKGDLLTKLERFNESTEVLREVWPLLENNYERYLPVHKEFTKTKTSLAFILNNLGWNFFKTGKYQEGINFSSLALEFEPDNLFILDTIACCWFELGKIRKSKKIFNKILSKIQNKEDLKALTIEIAEKVYEASKDLEKFQKKIQEINTKS